MANRLLQDPRGDTSSMRLAFVLVVVTGCAVALVGTVLGRDLSGLALVVAALLTPAFGGKAVQAKNERVAG